MENPLLFYPVSTLKRPSEGFIRHISGKAVPVGLRIIAMEGLLRHTHDGTDGIGEVPARWIVVVRQCPAGGSGEIRERHPPWSALQICVSFLGHECDDLRAEPHRAPRAIGYD
jgi:hypothetical protein